MKVSVALCTYNGEQYIGEQIQSILTQTRQPDEIVVCDDKSTDNTVKIIEGLLDNSSVKHTVVVNDDNLGYTKNFEKALSLCIGDIVIFSDQDDYWFERKIENMEQAFINDNDCVYCYCDAKITDEKLEVWFESLNEQSGISGNNFLMNVIMGKFPFGCCVAVRKNVAMNWIPFSLTHDNSSALYAPLYGNVVEITEPLMYYRRHSNTLTKFFEKTNNYIDNGEHRYKLLHGIRRITKKQWFIDSEIICNRIETVFSDEKWLEMLKEKYWDMYVELCKRLESAKYYKKISQSNRFFAVYYLLCSFVSSNYKFRGNCAILFKDILYSVFHLK